MTGLISTDGIGEALKPAVKYLTIAGIFLAVIGIGVFGFRWWLANYTEEQVENAGNAASVEAYGERDTFLQDVKAAILEVDQRSQAKVAAIERRFESYEQLQQQDWDRDLQQSSDFVFRANRATDRLWDRRQQRLREIFAGGSGLPAAPDSHPAEPQADAVPGAE